MTTLDDFNFYYSFSSKFDDDRELHTFMARRKMQDGNLDLGYAVIHEPDGDCIFVMGSFRLSEYVEEEISISNDPDYTPKYRHSVGYTHDINAEKEGLREILREAYKNRDTSEPIMYKPLVKETA